MKRCFAALALIASVAQAQTSTVATSAMKISQSASTFGTVTLTTDVDGVLPVANGGTGSGTACTATYVLFAGASGVQNCAAGFVFGSSKLTVPDLVDSGLTITRIPFASTDGLLIDNAALTFTITGGILDTTAIRPSGLSITRMPFASTGGLLVDSANLTYTVGGEGALSVNKGSVTASRFLSKDNAGAPTVADTIAASCGTTAATIAGKDQAATITVGGTSGTSCTVTFGTAWSVNIPACVASQNGTSVITSVVPTLTNLVIAGTFAAGDKIAFICLGY